MLTRHRTRRRTGQVALLTVFAVFTLLLLISGVLNATRVTAIKMEQQNAADASAHAAGVELARGMNAISALNHLITELNAMNAIIMGFGGKELDEGRSVRLPNGEASSALFNARLWSGGTSPAATTAARTSTSKSGAAIGDSRKKLLKVLGWAYRVHAAGGVMTRGIGLSMFASAGRELVRAANVMERSVEHEWEVLDAIENLVESRMLPIKRICEQDLIPQLYRYCERVVLQSSIKAEDAAEAVADQHGGAEGTLFPNTRGLRFRLQLPVEKESMSQLQLNHERSQMVRGMSPWVQIWRKPILDFSRLVLNVSEFTKHYHKYSNEFTLEMAWKQYSEKNTKLYRLKDLDVTGPDKGGEPWTKEDGSNRANELFGVIGFAHLPPPSIIGMPIFRQPQPDGMAAFAQVMIYNANRQDRPRKSKWQPVVGWDTLAWDDDVPEFEFGKPEGSDRNLDKSRNQPRIKLNWQTKLVPVAVERLTNSRYTQHSDLNSILGRLTTNRPIMNTH
jgi:hypothetical protein